MQKQKLTKKDIKALKVKADGGARGNPGPAGTGYVISAITSSAEIILKKCGNYLGKKTNNQAEYQALIQALEWLISANLTSHPLEIQLDSLLVVRQLQGEWKIKNHQLKLLAQTAQKFLTQFPSATLTHVKREDNKKADELVNLAIDEKRTVNG